MQYVTFIRLVFKRDKVREILNVGEHRVLFHHQLVLGHQQLHQTLVKALDLRQVIVLYELQLGNIQPADGSSVELKIQ